MNEYEDFERRQQRTRLLVGDGKLERLRRAHVLVLGVGGVGAYAAEQLARAGVGRLTLVDGDVVEPSNCNRQLPALTANFGRPKAEVMAERVRDINPACRVRALRMFYLPENAGEVDLSRYDYVVDAVDTVSAKLELAVRCQALGVPLISAMGSGNKLDPSAFSVSDLSKTEGCPLARVMRKELRKRGIHHLKVVWSREEPRAPLAPPEAELPPGGDTRPASSPRRAVPGSVSFVPGAAGLVLAGAVIRDLAGL